MRVLTVGCSKCDTIFGCITGKKEMQCTDCTWKLYCDARKDKRPDIEKTCSICQTMEDWYSNTGGL